MAREKAVPSTTPPSRRIIAEAGVRVQVAGGIRDLDAIDRWAAAGATRIVLGTLAVEQPDAVSEATSATATASPSPSTHAKARPP